MWLNLGAMCVFLANGASGVVFAILASLGIYPKVAPANGRRDAVDEAWVEGSGVLDAFRASRPVKHWHHGYGFAIAVDTEKEKPYLVCFANGLAEWYVLHTQTVCSSHSMLSQQ